MSAPRCATKAIRPPPATGSLHVYDPFNYDVQIASIAEENAFRRLKGRTVMESFVAHKLNE